MIVVVNVTKFNFFSNDKGVLSFEINVLFNDLDLQVARTSFGECLMIFQPLSNALPGSAFQIPATITCFYFVITDWGMYNDYIRAVLVATCIFTMSTFVFQVWLLWWCRKYDANSDGDSGNSSSLPSGTLLRSISRASSALIRWPSSRPGDGDVELPTYDEVMSEEDSDRALHMWMTKVQSHMILWTITLALKRQVNLHWISDQEQ